MLLPMIPQQETQHQQQQQQHRKLEFICMQVWLQLNNGAGPFGNYVTKTSQVTVATLPCVNCTPIHLSILPRLPHVPSH